MVHIGFFRCVDAVSPSSLTMCASCAAAFNPKSDNGKDTSKCWHVSFSFLCLFALHKKFKKKKGKGKYLCPTYLFAFLAYLFSLFIQLSCASDTSNLKKDLSGISP
ncbi:hypothetical protein BS78_09G223400 [Paspalum vaginatum]|nr:hypothetical protein BS78_09G223400 [Paspalum vaginatum]